MPELKTVATWDTSTNEFEWLGIGPVSTSSLGYSAFDPTLVLWLPLYRRDGATFPSADAHGHACTPSGAYWTPQGWYFDKSNDSIKVPHKDAITPPGGFTVAVLCKPNSITGTQMLASKNVDGNGFSSPWQVYLDGTNVIVRVGDGVWFEIATATGAAVAEQWLRVVGVYESGQQVLCYVNGQRLAATASTRTPHSNTADVYVGYYAVAAAWPFGGLIADVAILNRAWTPAEVLCDYVAAQRWMARHGVP